MKLLHQALLMCLAAVFFAPIAFAQGKKLTCPAFELLTPNQPVIEGDVMTLSVTVGIKVPDPKLTIHWSLSAGEILSGQGTNSIQVNTNNLGGEYLTVTVEAKGLPYGCNVTKTESFAIKPGCPSFKVEQPTATVEEGQPILLSAKVTGSRSQFATFHWMVSAGKIRRGQATSAIEVDTTKLGGVGILAAVELGGVPPACRMNEVVAVMIAKKSNKKSKSREITTQ